MAFQAFFLNNHRTHETQVRFPIERFERRRFVLTLLESTQRTSLPFVRRVVGPDGIQTCNMATHAIFFRSKFVDLAGHVGWIE